MVLAKRSINERSGAKKTDFMLANITWLLYIKHIQYFQQRLQIFVYVIFYKLLLRIKEMHILLVHDAYLHLTSLTRKYVYSCQYVWIKKNLIF